MGEILGATWELGEKELYESRVLILLIQERQSQLQGRRKGALCYRTRASS